MSRKDQNKKKQSKRSGQDSYSSDSEAEIHPSRPQYKGNPNRKWKHGEVVWAKYKNYPWWTGTIDLSSDSGSESESQSESNKNKSKNKSKTKSKSKTKIKNENKGKRKRGSSSSDNDDSNTIRVKWFGDFGSEIADCKLKHVIPFDKSKMKEIMREVQRVDIDQFKQCCHEAEKVDSELKEELGVKRNKEKEKENENEDNGDNEDEEEEEDIDIKVNSKKEGRHNRPSYKSKKNKETVAAPPYVKSKTKTKIKGRRKSSLRGSNRVTRHRNDDNENENDSADENENDSDNSKNKSKNKTKNKEKEKEKSEDEDKDKDKNKSGSGRRRSARLRESKTEVLSRNVSGRKRKLSETGINSPINPNSGRNVRQKQSGNSKNSNNGNNSNSNSSSSNDNNEPQLRRSARLNMQNYPSLNGFGILTEKDHESHWQSSLDMILDVNSAEDLTPFVGLVLHGLMKDSKLSYRNALKYCCDIFDFDLNALDAHMDFFYQDGMFLNKLMLLFFFFLLFCFVLFLLNCICISFSNFCCDCENGNT